jgi:hypothetical protein
MNTEDKFYFGKHGQPERFGNAERLEALLDAVDQNLRFGNAKTARQMLKKAEKELATDTPARLRDYMRELAEWIKSEGFSSPGQPDEFDLSEACWDGYEPVGTKRKDGRTVPNCVPMKNEKPEKFGLMQVELSDAGRSSMVSTDEFKRYAIANIPGVSRSDFLETMIDKVNAWAKQNGKGVRAKVAVKGMDFSRPGQPERFGLGLGDWKIDFRNVMKERVDQLKQLAKTLKASVTLNRISPNGYYSGSVSRKYGAMEPPDLNAPGKVRALIQSLGGYIGAAFSRPGQPERFDASSLDRKGFAAASSSPMLGKLLSEKQMPEGGWRAVETGGNALVISFEDGDVAGNFARRVASNGYSATAPVQSIGRYWNVEVKNGK